jgi:coenzyme Q-binding protein COQ10
MPGTSHTEIFNCSCEEFFKIASDYERYPEFLSEVKSCRVLKAENNKKQVEYKVAVIKTFTYVLSMQENYPESITWQFVSGDIFKTQSGSWTLVDEAGRTRATYAVDATFSMFVPGPIAKTLLTVNLPTMMGAYHQRVKELYGK